MVIKHPLYARHCSQKGMCISPLTLYGILLQNESEYLTRQHTAVEFFFQNA